MRGENPAEEVKHHLRALSDLIKSEMEEHLFFHVPAARARYFSKTALEVLGQDCCDRFGSIVPEVEEGMKCYAVGRYTACAFHLMRAMEAGARALGIAIGAQVKSPNWGVVFREYDDQYKMPLLSRGHHWRTHGSFLEDIAGDLRAVKNVWRNPTNHLEKSYDEPEAEKLVRAVPDFLRVISVGLDENGKLL